MTANHQDGLQFVMKEEDRAPPSAPREIFSRAVSSTLKKKNPADATRLFRDYLANAPKRNNYPSKAMAHYWLGRIEENQNKTASAKREYQEALNLEPKNRFANEALKRLRHD